MKKLFLPFVCTCSLFVFLAGCGEAPRSAEKKTAEKPEAVTGQTALWKMYQVARSWAPDAEVLRLSGQALQEVPAPPGQAGAWEVAFTSAARSVSRTYTFSVIDIEPTLHKGVFAGTEQSWTGPSGNTSPFLIAAVKIDSDAAYQTALKNGGAEYDRKGPRKPITMILEKVSKHPNPAWRVIWGESAGTSDFSVFVDASTGNFLERMH
jgi:hypothetical protein